MYKIDRKIKSLVKESPNLSSKVILILNLLLEGFLTIFIQLKELKNELWENIFE